MEDKIGHSNHTSINTIEVEVRIGIITIREDIKAGLGPTMCTEVIQEITKIIEAEEDIITIIEVVMDIICKVIKGMKDITTITIITEEVVIEVKVMIGIGVGHIKDKIETEKTVEVLVIVGQDQIQGQVQIEIGSDVSNVGNMITSQGNVHLGKEVGK